MFHFFAPSENAETGVITLTGSDVNHVAVLRLKCGDQVVISDGNDVDSLCEITEITADRVVTRVLPDAVADAELPAFLHLFQGLPKGDKMELILQKAVELGAASLIPVEMKRCVMKLDEKKKPARRDKWQKQAEAAAKQSGRRILPEVEEIQSFKQALKRAGELDRLLVPYECAEDMEHTRECLKAIRPGEHVGIWIGPEGGFEPAEIEQLRAMGAEIITLGPRILRTETAGMAVLAMCGLILQP